MKLNTKRTIFVGFAFFLICAFWQAYDTLLPKILVDQFGMSQTASGFIMAIDNILALFLLPLFGAISDKCRNRHGKRTPFIFIGTILASILVVVLSLVVNKQLDNLKDVSKIDDPKAMLVLYESEKDSTLKTPDGKSYVLSDKYTAEEFSVIPSQIETDGKTSTNPEYSNYVIPARQSYASKAVLNSRGLMILFLTVLVLLLLSMAIFRSPAVALMPDVTIKPLRSKANAIINLMGTAGGIIVLGLGMVFATGSIKNSMMSYTPFFCVIAGIMLAALFVFMKFVNEPKFVDEMQEESKKYHIEDSDADESGDRKLAKPELISLLLILSSVVFWFMGYNAVTSKYSVYADKVLSVDYNTTLMLANVAAIISYIPVGLLASKIGRKKTILIGVLLLAASFFTASFLREGSNPLIMNIMFALAGIGWATINVNSFPMVVELSRGGNVGKYTGFYYTASMAAQTLTPLLSGLFMDKIGLTTLFPYATIFVMLSFLTMCFVRHGDNKPQAKSALEAFDVGD